MWESLAALPELYKLGLSAWQSYKGNQFAKTPRPNYEIPTAAKDSLNLSKMMALNTELPGQPLMENKLSGATSAGIGAAKEVSTNPYSTMAAVTGQVAGQQDALGNLGISAAQNYNQNQQNLIQQYGNYAQWQEKQFDWNKIQPYMAAMNASAAMKGASEQNLAGGLKGIANFGLLGGFNGFNPQRTTTQPTAGQPYSGVPMQNPTVEGQSYSGVPMANPMGNMNPMTYNYLKQLGLVQ